jgi:hypothetical protein
MVRYIISGLILGLMVLSACSNVQTQSNHVLTVDAAQTLVQYQKSIGEWFDVDVECYGVALIKTDSVRQLGVPIRCRILSFSASGVKCRTTEDFKPFAHYGCQKAGTNAGDIWFETNNELFLTKEEALKHIRQHYIAL